MQAPEPPPWRRGLIAWLEASAGRQQNEHAGPDGFEFLVRPSLHAAQGRIHDLGVSGRPFDQDHIMPQAPVDQHMRDRRHRHASQGFDGPFHAPGGKPKILGGLDERIHRGTIGASADQLPQARNGQPQPVMVGHIFQACRSTIGGVALFEGNHGGSCLAQ